MEKVSGMSIIRYYRSGRLPWVAAVSFIVLALTGSLMLAAPLALGTDAFDDTFETVVSTSSGRWLLHMQPKLSRHFFGRTVVIEGSLARKARFQDPSSILVAPDGRIFVSDRRDHRIRVILEGRIETFIGDGLPGFAGDGGHRLDARIRFPEGLAMDGDGKLLFADAHNHRIRAVDSNGHVRTVAGSGVRGFSGDGGSATKASLKRPSDVCVSGDGSMLIADVGNHAVRRVTPDGVVETVAGTGTPGFSGDGAPGYLARLNQPWGIDCLPNGEVLIADAENHRIRKLTADGLIATVAGSGRFGLGDDGVPALAAEFNSPQEVVADSAGGFFVVDEHNHRIRHVDRSGVTHTVAGTGHVGESANGTLATSGDLNDPEDVWMLGAGDVLIADGDNCRIRRMDARGQLWIVAGS